MSDSNKTKFSGQILVKVSQYKISRKSVQWQPSCSIRTDRRTERMKLIVVSAPSRTPGQSATARRARTRAHTALPGLNRYLCFEAVCGWPLACSEDCVAPRTLCTSLLVFQYLCCGHFSVLTGILMRVPLCGCMSHLLCNGPF
jgi:hypothetical protein